MEHLATVLVVASVFTLVGHAAGYAKGKVVGYRQARKEATPWDQKESA